VLTDYLVGTGGWAYFKVPNKTSLKAYSEIFNFVEVNNTFYEYPELRKATNWRRTVSKDFTFSIRCHHDLTHRIGLKPVDAAILGYEDVGFGFEQVLTEVKPDIVAFGYDQEKLENTVAEIIRRHNLNIKMARLSKFNGERYVSSSSLRQRLSEELS